MVEETDSCGDTRFAFTIQIEPDADIGLVRLTMNLCGSRHSSAI
jgi:hypothetical protein